MEEAMVASETMVNLDSIEMARLQGAVEEAKLALQRHRVRVAVASCYGSWQRFIELVRSGEIK